jgi:acyl-[acyl-carrier-protein] desaturase
VHRDEVLLPILRHWKIFELSGLDAAAEDARRRLEEYLAKLDESIARFEERVALSPIPRIAAAK